MWRRYETRLTLAALLAVGCGGNAVDLGHNQDARWTDAPMPSPRAAAAPQTIYDSAEPLLGFALDGPTLYALIDGKQALELITCPLERCRSERTTLFSRPQTDGQAQPTPLVLAGDMLYWVDSREQRTVEACPTTGCSKPQVLATGWDRGLAADDEGAYWIDFERRLMRGSPNAEAPTFVQDLPPEASFASNLLAHGDDVYFVAQDTNTFGIRRVPKDGSRQAELVATDQVISGFSVAGDTIYYLSRILTGRVATCPLEGCSAEASTLAANQRWPGAIKVEGNELFWLNSTQWDYQTSKATLVSCQLPDCAKPQTRLAEFSFASGVEQDQSFAVNQDSIAWLEGAHGVGTRLRRLAR